MKKISISSPIITPLKIAGIIADKTGTPLILIFLVLYIDTVARNVAKVPKIISRGKAPIDIKLVSMHPTVSPGIAYGVKMQSIVSASLSLN